MDFFSIFKIFQNKLNFSMVLMFMTIMSMLIMYFWLNFDMKVIYEYELIMMSSCSMSLAIILDSVSLSFSMVVLIISSCVFMFASSYMEEDIYYWRFLWLLLSFVLSMQLLVYSGSLFFMLLGWDGLGITSFALIIYYQSSESLSAGFQTLMINRIGDAIIVSAVGFMILGGGLLMYMKYSDIIFILLSVAALTKSAQYPFSSWLPAAMAAPTPVSALVHSSTLVTAGIFIIIRFFMVYEISYFVSSMFLLLGSITCLLGGLAANKENDIKKIIALSTLSQLGIMVFSLGLALPNMTLFHLYTHAMFKALLFLAAGSLLMLSFGAQDLRLMGNLGMNKPFIIIIFNISSLCLIAMPFMSAFYSKHLILELLISSSSTNMISMYMMFMATIFTAMYVFRTLKIMCWTTSNMSLSLNMMSFKVTMSMLILSMFAIISGNLFQTIFMWFNEVSFTYSYLSLWMQVCLIIGMISGMLFTVKNGYWFLSSLFFLVPLYINSIKINSLMSKHMVGLDYGWLEPSTLIKQYFLNTSYNFNMLLTWPSMRGTLFRSLFMMLFLMVLYAFIIL